MNSFWSRSLILLCILIAIRARESHSESLKNLSVPKDVAYAIHLYKGKDYYRTVSEILKIRFQDEETMFRYHLDTALLKSCFHLKEYDAMERYAGAFLESAERSKENTGEERTGRLYALALYETGKRSQAYEVWLRYAEENERELFPMKGNIANQIDPDRAKLFSTVLPGSGFLLSEQYTKAAVSFLLNAVFIAGTYTFAMKNQYGIAGLCLFFEIGWYFGGRNASAEAAREYNSALFNKQRDRWIRSVIYQEE